MLVTDIRAQKSRKNRYNIFTEDGFLLSLSDETIVKNSIKRGSELSPELLAQLKEEDTFKYAKELAFKYVSYSPRTEKQLLKKLYNCEIDEETAAKTLAVIKEYGYIDDSAFALQYAESYLKKYGEKVVLAKLIAEGVDESTAQSAVAEKATDDGLKALAEKYAAKYASLDDKTRKRKTAEALMRRGFSWDKISDALNTDFSED